MSIKKILENFIDAIRCFRAFDIPEKVPLKILNLVIALYWIRNTHYYLKKIGRAPNYVCPKTLSDKMQWRKIFDKNPLFQIFSDKLLVRDYVLKKTTGVKTPKIFWSGNKVNDIPFGYFNGAYVIKPNNGNGNMFFIEDSTEVDENLIKKECKQWLSKPFGKNLAEWGYWKIDPKIIVEEKLLPSEGNESLVNYKFFVFHGETRIVQVESIKSSKKCLTFFDRNGVRLPIMKWVSKHKSMLPELDVHFSLPDNFSLMIKAAEEISNEVDCLRVDLYESNGEVYLSELTCYDGSGYSYFFEESEKYDVRPTEKLNREYNKYWNQPELSYKEMVYRVFFKPD